MKNFKGVTTVPGSEMDPSKDGNVNIYTNSDLIGIEVPLNAAHEILAHGYLYELQQQGVNVDYLHRKEVQIMYDENGMPDGIVPVETNKRLIEEINKSENEVKNNNK